MKASMGALILVVCFFVLSFVPHIHSKPPNIVFILSDDLGYGDLEMYWNNNTHGRIKTPYLNQMAAQGTMWQQVYAGGSICSPSRCALFTGVHTGHARIRGNDPEYWLLPEDVTIPMLLKKANYSTSLIGKWDLGDNGTTGMPTLKGFDYFQGYLSNDQAKDYYPASIWENTDPKPIPGNMNGDHTVYSADYFTNLTLSYISEHAHDENPFFLFVAYTIPHVGGVGTQVQNGCPVPSQGIYANESWPPVERDFAAMITRMDSQVGQIFAQLADLGIDNDTIVFFTSDNGAQNASGHDYTFFGSSGPLRSFKGAVFEGGIRAPMIVRWPGKVPAGRIDNTSVWAHWDVMPTLADIAGIPQSQWPNNTDGKSRLPTLLGQSQNASKYLYWEFCCNRQFRQGIRSGDWKGVRQTLTGDFSLFNVTADVGEKKNLANQNPAVVNLLKSYLLEAHVESPIFPSNPCVNGC